MKSLGENAANGQGRVVGLIKSCCNCGALVTRSHAITEISVCEESAPTTHFLPIEEGEGGAKNGTVCCTKHKGGIIFYLEEFKNPTPPSQKKVRRKGKVARGEREEE